MAEDLTGKKLGPFVIERRLGQGAMGAVYVGVHEAKGSRVAIKVVLPAETKEKSEKLAARFEREIKLLSQFRHPNIVRFYGASEDKGIRFYAMELVDGQSLDDLLDDQGVLPLPVAVKVLVQICEALQELHSTGVVHRDLKPGNVLVGKDGKVKLTDFGIARDTSAYSEERLTKADHTVGTIAYMSPEQLAGQELTRKSDLYSLGLLMYRVLTGRLPFIGETMFDYMQQRQRGIFPAPSTLNNDLSTDVDSLLRDVLAQDPADRPKDAYVVMQRLMEIGKGAKSSTNKPKVRPATAVLDTVDMRRSGFSTLLATVFGSKEETGKKKKSSRGTGDDEPPTSWLESPILLVAALLGVIGFTTYMFWPLPDTEKFRRAKEIIDRPEAPIDEMVRADEEFLVPILAADPASPLAGDIATLREKIEVTRARGRTNLAKATGFIDPKATEAEKQYVAALRLEAQGDKANAQSRFESVVRMFSKDSASKPIVMLAMEKLSQGAKYASDDERVQEKRRPVKKALEEVRELRKEGKLKEALDQYASIEQLYGSDREVSDLIEEAGVEFLSVEDLFARGEQLMTSEVPADWKRAFQMHFSAVLKRSPSPEMLSAIDRFRDKVAMHEANEKAEEDLRIGIPNDAAGFEALYVTALYLRDELQDDQNCLDVWRKIAADAGTDEASRGWKLLSKMQVEKGRVVADESTRRAEKRALAERAWSRLSEMMAADPDAKGWRTHVEKIYASDEVIVDVVKARTEEADGR
jgi:serine/threonine-protein kinase